MISQETPNIMVRVKYYPSGGGDGTYSGRRSFYASGGADDYMKYIDKGIENGNKEKSDYIDYVGSDAKSAGVFGNDGLLRKEQKAEIRKQLRATGGVVWDMIISFKEGYGDRYMQDMKTAQGLLKARLNRFFKQAGLIPDNTVWFAGLHENTDNRHIHVCFFEREPMFLQRGKEGKHYHHGRLRQTGIDAFKLSIERYFSDTAMQLKADRAEVIAAARESVNHDKKIKDKIEGLVNRLPLTGKLGYDSENMKPLRAAIDGIRDYIVKHYKPAGNAYIRFCSRLRKRDDEIRESCRKQRIRNISDFLVSDKVAADLYRRIGNQVIGFALNIRQRQDKDRQARISNAPLYKRRTARRDVLKSLRDCLKLKAITEAECMRDFEDYLRRLEEAAPEAEYEKRYQSEMEL